MKMQPVTKGRKQAVKRVERVLEVECQRARKALQRTAYEYGERDPRTITAHARYVETCGLQQAFSQGLQEYLQSLGRKTSPDAQASAMAVKPPDSTKQTGMSTS